MKQRQKKMKIWIAVGAVAIATYPAIGRAQDESQAKTIQMVSAQASLNKGIDTKKAKQGDAVTAKLQEDVKIPGSFDLPRNTVLLGHIDQVQPSENKGDSSIQVTFDNAQLKDGKQLALKATIMKISAPSGAFKGDATPAGNAPSAPASSGRPGQTIAKPNIANGSSAPEAQPSDSGIPGIQLQSDIHQSYSGIFTAKRENVHLYDGTLLSLALAVVPANAQVQ
jgi:hypothetical protein